MNRIRRMLLILAGAVACAGCPRPLPVPVPPPSSDAGVRLDASPTCAAFCAEGRARGCDWARNTRAGAPCEDVCANATTGGPLVWDLACRIGNLESGRGCPSVDLCP